MEIIAHRGVHRRKEEENTTFAFNKAVLLGCPMIELDVRCTCPRDKQLVVIHDDIFNVRGFKVRVADQRLDQLIESGLVVDRLIGAGGHNLAPELRIPTLRFVLKLFLHRTKINIELKDAGSGLALYLTLDRMLRNVKPEIARESLKNLVVSSFLKEELLLFKAYELGAQIETALLLSRLSPSRIGRGRLGNWLKKNNIQALHMPYEIVTAEAVNYFKSKEIGVRIYTLNILEQMEYFESIGVQGIFTDKAEEFIRTQRTPLANVVAS
ncbi:MAG: glycerophosphodiester phosphodiesterase family protein [bacterium]|nr:glycerophosphodiester phosphodiesterase family protein [bacterium]